MGDLTSVIYCLDKTARGESPGCLGVTKVTTIIFWSMLSCLVVPSFIDPTKNLLNALI